MIFSIQNTAKVSPTKNPNDGVQDGNKHPTIKVYINKKNLLLLVLFINELFHTVRETPQSRDTQKKKYVQM